VAMTTASTVRCARCACCACWLLCMQRAVYAVSCLARWTLSTLCAVHCSAHLGTAGSGTGPSLMPP
jgi:hypothetical protein